MTSIAAAQAMLEPTFVLPRGECTPSWFPNVIAHNDALLNGFSLLSPPKVAASPLPVFVDEDWAIRNVISSSQSAVSDTFSNDQCPFAPDFAGNVANDNVFDFLASNDDGLRYFYRSQAWSAGVISHAYLSFLGPRRTVLSDPITTTTWEPMATAARFARTIEAWRFSYDPTLVVLQSPQAPSFLTPISLSTRTRFELEAVGAKSDHGNNETKYVIYCPYDGTTTVGFASPGPGPAGLTIDLSELGASHTFSYYYLNPDTGSASATLTATTPATAPYNVAFSAPSAPVLGPHNEYVLVINQ